MVLWHQFSSQMMEASRPHHQLGQNTDPLPPPDLSLSIWRSLLYKSTPDPCSTFQHLLIDFMCIVLPQKVKLYTVTDEQLESKKPNSFAFEFKGKLLVAFQQGRLRDHIQSVKEDRLHAAAYFKRL